MDAVRGQRRSRAQGRTIDQAIRRPAASPIEALLDGIGNLRAHLYTACHSGRTKEAPRGSEAMPISRTILAELSVVGASSQRAYEA